MKAIKTQEGGKTPSVLKIQMGDFLADWLSQLLFVNIMMPISNQLRKCTGGYKFIDSQEKIKDYWKRITSNMRRQQK